MQQSDKKKIVEAIGVETIEPLNSPADYFDDTIAPKLDELGFEIVSNNNIGTAHIDWNDFEEEIHTVLFKGWKRSKNVEFIMVVHPQDRYVLYQYKENGTIENQSDDLMENINWYNNGYSN